MDENVYQSWKVLNQQLDASDVNENDFILIVLITFLLKGEKYK